MIKYLVVGSPGRYKLKPVSPGQADYESGMSEQAAQNTANDLNNKFFERIGERPPTPQTTTQPDPVVEQPSTPTAPMQPQGQALPSDKIKELQRSLGVTADGIIGPITIAAAKDAIGSSRTYSEAVGLSSKYDLILNVDKYRTSTKTISAPSEPPTQKEKIDEAVDIFTTTLFPPTAVVKALTGNQTIGPETPTSIDMAGEWVMIDKAGFSVYKDEDILRGAESAKEPRWYNTKTGRSISIVDKEGRPILPESANGKPVDKSIINSTSLGRWESSFNDYLDKNLIEELKNKSSNIESIFSNVGVIRPNDIDKLDEIGLRGLANELGIDVREYSTKPTYQEAQAGKKPELIRDELAAGIINFLSEQKTYDDYDIIGHDLPEVEESLEVSTVGPTEVKQEKYPKVKTNAKGESSIIRNATDEYYAALAGFTKTLDVSNFDEAPGFFVDLAIDQSGNLVKENSSTGESVIVKTLTPQETTTATEIKNITPTSTETIPTDEGEVVIETPTTGGGVATGTGLASESSGQMISNAQSEFLNVPKGAWLWDVDGVNYLVYEVPGANGEVYEGNPIYMAYEVMDNDLVKAGIVSPEAPTVSPNAKVNKAFFDSVAIVTGNTDQLSSLIDNPFASFVETINEQSQVAPWITDPEMISLIAEAAVEGREISDAEWQTTNWYQTNNQSQRDWLRTYYADPATATQTITDGQIAVANSLQAAGVSNAPEALVNWISSKYVTGDWSQTYTTEQISLFADPYAEGKRDESLENYLSSTALTGVDRTTEREREVTELYNKWLGPTLGKLTDNERAEIAGKLRDDPDYEDALISSLKQSRLAAFSNYTNPELTYEDIARPWRNLTTSVWGQTADETQGWWQEMVKTNDFAKAQTTLREKGLEQDITQVTTDATQALQQALGQGSVSQTGVNV
jgi:hypothetical protein